MKKVVKIIGMVLGVIVLIAAGYALFIQFTGIPTYEPQKVDLKVEITPERITQGQKIATMECITCHAGDDGKLTGRYLKEFPPQFGAFYSRNITNDPEKGIGTWTDGELYYLLRTGVGRDGKFYPVMAKFPLASDEDIYSVIAWLRSDSYPVQATKEEAPESDPSFLGKFLAHAVIKPLKYSGTPILPPDTNNLVEHGKYLSTALYACYGCHSADFTKMNEMEPEKSGGFFGGGNVMKDLNGNSIATSNLTFDETGIGAYTLEDFIQVIKQGKKRNGEPLRYPMFPRPQLTEREITAIYAYLQTIPKIKNDISQLKLD